MRQQEAANLIDSNHKGVRRSDRQCVEAIRSGIELWHAHWPMQGKGRSLPLNRNKKVRFSSVVDLDATGKND